MELDKIEKMLFRGLVAREREIEREMLAPLREDYNEFTTMLEKNHKLEEGDIGSKYDINPATMTLEERPQPVTEEGANVSNTDSVHSSEAEDEAGGSDD